MRYFVDTEFSWQPDVPTIVPISIGIVAEDGREFYAVSRNADAYASEGWFGENVRAVLGTAKRLWLAEIRDRIKAFIGDDTPEFWGDCAAFDYVVLSYTMGDFSDWPEGWPMHVNDLQQDAIPSVASAIPHNALSDARAVRDAWDHAFQAEGP